MVKTSHTELSHVADRELSGNALLGLQYSRLKNHPSVLWLSRLGETQKLAKDQHLEALYVGAKKAFIRMKKMKLHDDSIIVQIRSRFVLHHLQ